MPRFMTAEQAEQHQKRVKDARLPRSPIFSSAASGEAVGRGAKPGKGSKYKNEPTWVDGIRFDSKKEALRWQDLRLREMAGEISNLVHHRLYALVVNGYLICEYEADYVYDERSKTIVEDAKGVRTDVYKLKKKLMKAIYGIEIFET